jgi:CheY-like chemotaxis protein
VPPVYAGPRPGKETIGVTDQRPRPNVLIVEDHPEVRRTLTEILQEGGYAVTSAADGQEALDRLRTAPLPHLILLDLLMPVMDGWEFRRRQREDPAIAAIPIVVISGGETSPHSPGFVDAASYLLKPIDFDVLLSTIARLCRRHGPADNLMT